MTAKHTGTIAIAIALTLLAAALWRIGSELPELNRHLERLGGVGETLSGEVPGMVDVANRYEPHIDPLLQEVAASRALAEKALSESAAYRSELPALLARLDALDARLAELQGQLPAVLSRVDNALDESKAWRPISEQALTEAQSWRSDIPLYLDRSEKLVAGARQAGKEASSGMVSGFVTGTLSLPFKALGNVGELFDPRSLSARRMTDEDRRNLRAAAIALLDEPAQKTADWSSSESGHAGTVTVLESRVTDERTCHTLEIVNRFKGGQQETIQHHVCKNARGEWAISKP